VVTRTGAADAKLSHPADRRAEKARADVADPSVQGDAGVPAKAAPPVEGLDRYVLMWAPWIVLAMLIWFIGINVLDEEASNPAGRMWRAVALGGVLIGTAIWFIVCFTGEAEQRLRSGFVFAYAFTFGAFALLVTPFVGSEPAPDPAIVAKATREAVRPREGVLQLVRGCVVADAESVTQVSTVTRCPQAKWAEPVATAASGPMQPRQEVGRQFAWMMSVGGVTVRKFQSSLPEDRERDGYVEIYGGLVIPFFVVVLAFIGGAVSLSRRIPEYQRRADRHYVATDKEPAMKAFQAREAVVFQIMQLTSAPFLAMATWYIVSPATLAAAAGLAFGTGFASEPLLLMIRGMVDGLRPEGARPSAPPKVELRGKVVEGDARLPSQNATLTLSIPNNDSPRTALTDAKGEFVFAGVEVGCVVRLTAEKADKRVERELTVADKLPPIELQL
jgi:hypothetical protein